MIPPDTFSLLPDYEIARLARDEHMIEPFVAELVRKAPDRTPVISYGLSSFGYDIRVAGEFRIFSAGTGDLAVVDPKHPPEKALLDYTGKTCIIPPNSFALARTVEHFAIPSDVLGLCVGKSTYARCGVVLNITPVECGWNGYLTLEISNTTPLPVRIYANEGIAQMIFFRGPRPDTTYAERRGKYQNQTGITLARV